MEPATLWHNFLTLLFEGYFFLWKFISLIKTKITICIIIWQEEVFGAVGKKIVEGCVAGYNGTIFA